MSLDSKNEEKKITCHYFYYLLYALRSYIKLYTYY